MAEVVRLKFQWNWATPGRFTWKIEIEQSCKSQLFKVTNTGKSPQMFSLVYILPKTMSNFCSSKLPRKSKWKQRGYFDYWYYIKKSAWKQRRFFDHWNYIDKSTWKKRGFLDQRNYIEKVRRNYVEIRRNLVFDVSAWFRSQIDVDLTWCACWVITLSSRTRNLYIFRFSYTFFWKSLATDFFWIVPIFLREGSYKLKNGVKLNVLLQRTLRCFSIFNKMMSGCVIPKPKVRYPNRLVTSLHLSGFHVFLEKFKKRYNNSTVWKI